MTRNGGTNEPMALPTAEHIDAMDVETSRSSTGNQMDDSEAGKLVMLGWMNPERP